MTEDYVTLTITDMKKLIDGVIDSNISLFASIDSSKLPLLKKYLFVIVDGSGDADLCFLNKSKVKTPGLIHYELLVEKSQNCLFIIDMPQWIKCDPEIAFTTKPTSIFIFNKMFIGSVNTKGELRKLIKHLGYTKHYFNESYPIDYVRKPLQKTKNHKS